MDKLTVPQMSKILPILTSTADSNTMYLLSLVQKSHISHEVFMAASAYLRKVH